MVIDVLERDDLLFSRSLPEFQLGRAALIKSVIEGKGNMKPRADKPEFTDEDIGASVDYLMDRLK